MADNKLCDVLGVRSVFDFNMTNQDMKTRKEFEPDKNSEADMFKEIDKAYKILFEPKDSSSCHKIEHNIMQTKAYDNFGKDNTFSQFLGGDGFFSSAYQDRGTQRQRISKDTIYPLMVTLENMYNGRTFQLQFNKNVICAACRGKGSKIRHTQKCHICGGCGQKMVYHQIGPWMTDEVQIRCPRCQGNGRIVTKWDRCSNCEGKKVCIETKIIEVYIERGLPKNQKIFFPGEGHQHPDMEPGNIVIILQEKPHEYFQKRGNDLHIKHTILLREALCGFSFTLRHLDGRDILITHPAGEVIKPGDVKVVKGEGMPHYKNPLEKGDLLVKFEVKFPESRFTTESNLKTLETLLPPKTPFVMPDANLVEEVILEDLSNNASDED